MEERTGIALLETDMSRKTYWITGANSSGKTARLIEKAKRQIGAGMNVKIICLDNKIDSLVEAGVPRENITPTSLIYHEKTQDLYQHWNEKLYTLIESMGFKERTGLFLFLSTLLQI